MLMQLRARIARLVSQKDPPNALNRNFVHALGMLLSGSRESVQLEVTHMHVQTCAHTPPHTSTRTCTRIHLTHAQVEGGDERVHHQYGEERGNSYQNGGYANGGSANQSSSGYASAAPVATGGPGAGAARKRSRSRSRSKSAGRRANTTMPGWWDGSRSKSPRRGRRSRSNSRSRSRKRSRSPKRSRSGSRSRSQSRKHKKHKKEKGEKKSKKHKRSRRSRSRSKSRSLSKSRSRVRSRSRTRD
jgi:hypothetical protein